MTSKPKKVAGAAGIYRRDRDYIFRLTYVDATGLRRNQWINTGPDKSRAIAERAAAIRAVRTGTFVQPSEMTVRQLFDIWVPWKAADLEGASLAKYKRDLRLHVVPTIGDMLIQDVKGEILTRLLADLAVSGRVRVPTEDEPRRCHPPEVYALIALRRDAGSTYQAIADEIRRRWPQEKTISRHVVAGIVRRARARESGRPIDAKPAGLKRSSIEKVREAMKGPFAYALDENWISENPVTKAKLPRRMRGAKAKPKKKIWEPAQCRRFFEWPEVVEDRRYALWFFTSTSAERRGGNLGLLWDRVDFTKRRAMLDYFVEWDSDLGLILKDYAKTTDGHEIVVDTLTRDVLLAWRVRQNAERVRAGEAHDCALDDPDCPRPGYHDRGLVFADELGNYIKPNAFLQGFKTMIGRYNRLHPDETPLPVIDLHALRHGWNTLADHLSVSGVVRRDRLDHASVVVNEGYNQAMEIAREEAAENVAREMFGPRLEQPAAASHMAPGNYELAG